MKKYCTIFKDKVYELVGYSLIDYSPDYRYDKSRTDQIISNSKDNPIECKESYSNFYNFYGDMEEFMDKFATTIMPINSEYIIKFHSLIRGSFVYKLLNSQTNEEN